MELFLPQTSDFTTAAGVRPVPGTSARSAAGRLVRLVVYRLEDSVRARALVAIALSAVLAVSLSACSFFMQPETSNPYDPGDGVNFTVGDLELRNILVVSDDGETGSLVGTAVNNTSSAIDFTLQWNTDGVWYEVDLVAAANARTDFGFGDAQRVNLDNLGVMPGGLLDATVHADDTQKGEQLPVVDTSFVEYEDSLPTPTPTPTPTPSITPEPTETPAP